MSTDDETPPPVPAVAPPPAPPGYFYAWASRLPDGTIVRYGELINIEQFDAECDAEEDARWAALTDEERAAELARDAEVDAILNEQDRLRDEEHAAAKPKKKRRGKLSPLARTLATIARRLKKSKHRFLRDDALVIDLLIDGHRLPDVDDSIVGRIFDALGRSLPAENWLAVADFCARSLGTVFADGARYDRGRAAFEKGQRGKKKWKGKQQTKVADSLARGREILDELRNAATRK